MADEEQLRILKQGVKAWNDWRRTASRARVDLSGAKLGGVYLSEEINLSGAELRRADLSVAHLSQANLRWADLQEASLSWATLDSADLRNADLRNANLNAVSLLSANLSGAHLIEANLSGARLRDTNFVDLDLSMCRGLESCSHYGPSLIDIRTLQRSGRLPLVFLRGVGLPDTLIDYLPSLLNRAIQFYDCFISYSSKDDEFARRLHADLQAKSVRCWFAPEDMKIGANILDTLDEAIRLQDKVLLVLSEASIASDWVEDEVTKAFAEERRRGGTVLFPVRLDDAVFATKEAWALKLRDNRHIGDFRAWKDHDAYQRTLERLLRDLRVKTPDASTG
jgi:uncharacterized protein YjbI with pentapeptide repeats